MGHTATATTCTVISQCPILQASPNPNYNMHLLRPSPLLLHPRAIRSTTTTARVSTDATTTSANVDDRDRQRFVGWFHQAWPYVQIHKGSTFVVVIASEVVDDSQSFGSVLKDTALLHELGIRFVVITETCLQADGILEQKGRINKCRVTDEMALEAAMEAAGRVESEIMAMISPGPRVWNGGGWRHGGDARWCGGSTVSIATGNFLAASKQRTVDVEGDDHGRVIKIDTAGIRERLDQDSIVVLSNLGYSSTGEVINCNTYEIASACALAMKADRLICIVDGQTLDGETDHSINIEATSSPARKRSTAVNCQTTVDCVEAAVAVKSDESSTAYNSTPYIRNPSREMFDAIFHDRDMRFAGQGFAVGECEEKRRRRRSLINDCLLKLSAAVSDGVERVHFIDGRLEGVLLLELFSRDGAGKIEL